jgi:hypothetical protein
MVVSLRAPGAAVALPALGATNTFTPTPVTPTVTGTLPTVTATLTPSATPLSTTPGPTPVDSPRDTPTPPPPSLLPESGTINRPGDSGLSFGIILIGAALLTIGVAWAAITNRRSI